MLIKEGKIKKIAKSIKSCPKAKKNGNEIEYKAKNLHLSPGWFDLHVNFRDPGYEQKETIESGSNTAASGGFTGVMTMPNTSPNIDNKGMIEYIKNTNKGHIVEIIPAGNITKGGQGNELVEMHDMKNAGCVAFTDDKRSITNSELMKIAMLYSKDCKSLIMNYPNEENITKDSYVHEGEISTKLGLKGMPDIAEEMIVNRDISLSEYTNSKIHLSYLSSKRSVEKIKKAKREGINITSDVAIHNLILTENMLSDFDSRYKVKPPLRTLKDNRSLIKALKNNTIDVITSDHSPHEEEVKKIEFNSAAYGIIGLESMFGLLGKYILPHINLNQLIEKIAINPRNILGLEEISINEGKKANITLFNPSLSWEFNNEKIKSKSKNTPFIGERLTGKALAIYNNGQFREC